MREIGVVSRRHPAGRTFEALKIRRSAPIFGHLANVATVASVDDSSVVDWADTVRCTVREELLRHDEPQCNAGSAMHNRDDYQLEDLPASSVSPSNARVCEESFSTLDERPQPVTVRAPTRNRIDFGQYRPRPQHFRRFSNVYEYSPDPERELRLLQLWYPWTHFLLLPPSLSSPTI